MRVLKVFLLVGLLLFTGACAATSQPATAPQAAAPANGYLNISVEELYTRMESGEPLLLLDVRSPEEFSGDGHVAGATLIPLPELSQRMGELQQDEPIACICRSGNRSRTACDQLAQAGYTNLVNVEGGMNAWGAAGYPIEH